MGIFSSKVTTKITINSSDIQSLDAEKITFLKHDSYNLPVAETLNFDNDIKKVCFNVFSKKMENKEKITFCYYNNIIYCIYIDKNSGHLYISSKIELTSLGYVIK